MRVRDLGSAFNVSVSRLEVGEFRGQWPCSGLPDKTITFQFDKRNGDLIDLWSISTADGPAWVALSDDAKAYGFNRLKLM